MRKFRKFWQQQQTEIPFDAFNALFDGSHSVNDMYFSIYVREHCELKIICILDTMSRHWPYDNVFIFPVAPLAHRDWLSRRRDQLRI